jgi:hypothetical protein
MSAPTILPPPSVTAKARGASAAATSPHPPIAVADANRSLGGASNPPAPTADASATEHPAPVPNSPHTQKNAACHPQSGVGDQTTETTQLPDESQCGVGGLGPILADPLLAMCADVVDDLERVRCANENRLRTLTTNEPDSDGELRGHGLSLDNPDVQRLAKLVDALKDAEHQGILNLQRSMRQHPLGPWVKAQVGVGEKQAARLLASIRDPFWNDLHQRPRGLRELWAYCGFHVLDTSAQFRDGSHTRTGAGVDQTRNTAHDQHGNQGDFGGVAPTRKRGEKANWNDDARKRTWLIAASCIKQADSPYRKIYDNTRIKYADALHTRDCVRCGPKGKPALAGSPLSAGHQHARAMRAMCKEILRDLWLEAKCIHETTAAPMGNSHARALTAPRSNHKDQP